MSSTFLLISSQRQIYVFNWRITQCNTNLLFATMWFFIIYVSQHIDWPIFPLRSEKITMISTAITREWVGNMKREATSSAMSTSLFHRPFGRVEINWKPGKNTLTRAIRDIFHSRSNCSDREATSRCNPALEILSLIKNHRHQFLAARHAGAWDSSVFPDIIIFRSSERRIDPTTAFQFIPSVLCLSLYLSRQYRISILAPITFHQRRCYKHVKEVFARR